LALAEREPLDPIRELPAARTCPHCGYLSTVFYATAGQPDTWPCLACAALARIDNRPFTGDDDPLTLELEPDAAARCFTLPPATPPWAGWSEENAAPGAEPWEFVVASPDRLVANSGTVL
jgi:hypothetical protein